MATSAAIRDGWLHTGDMATLDEAGYVSIKDRSKDVIIRGGENISSVDVENALAGHPAVLECAVVAVPDERFGEAPVAIVVLKPGATATAIELKAYCKKHLARFKVPREFQFRDVAAQGRHRQGAQGRAARAVLAGPGRVACTDEASGRGRGPALPHWGARRMVPFMLMKTRMRVSKGGQISIPATTRHRWGTSTVVLEDQGDRVVVEPAPDDPIAAAEGALALELAGVDLTRLRRAAREEEEGASLTRRTR